MLTVWRLDDAEFAPTWDSGEGAYRAGGRWNNDGTRAVYCSTDPSAAILEVAVHNGFDTLDRVRHVLSEISIHEPRGIHVVTPADVPNPNWLVPGTPSAGQRSFGDELLRKHRYVLFPGVVSPESWNLVFIAAKADGAYSLKSQRPFALDGRLNPAP